MTVNSKSSTRFGTLLSVTRPTGLITSPTLKPNPGLSILNEVTVNNVEPIPVVELAPTSTLTRSPLPVSVVAPIPSLETPTTSRFV